MLFYEKLSAIKQLLNVTNSEIAKASGLDASCVSRCSRAGYVPSRFSSSIRRMANGIASLTEAREAKDSIRELCVAFKSENLTAALLRWLNADDSGLKKERAVAGARKKGGDKKIKQAESELISQKLDYIMEVLGASNSSLARYINVDSSSISRYRRCKRNTNAMEPTIKESCRYFAFLCRSQGIPAALAEVAGIKKEESADEESVAAKLFEWFFSGSKARLDSTQLFFSQIETIEETTENETYLDAEAAGPPAERVSLSEEMYFGQSGIRAAFAKFASAVMKCDRPAELCVYAADFSWFARDAAFCREWSSIMLDIAAKGHKIKVIHHLGLEIEEMFRVVEMWMPLYITGRISPYYLTQPHRSIFSEHMGTVDGLCSLQFSCLKENESETAAFFSEDPLKASYIKRQFDGLFAFSKPLMEIYTRDDIKKLYKDVDKRIRQSGDIIKVMPALSLESMPEHLAKKIFERHAACAKERAALTNYYRDRRAAFMRSLAEVEVTEVYPKYTEEEIKSGKLRLCRHWLAGDEESYYTPEEYRQHVEAIQQLAKEHGNYHCISKRDFPFKNIDLISKQGEITYIIKNDRPFAAFSFLNSYMNYVIERYIERFVKIKEK
ncbi:MAG: hypothetical protein RRY12_03050 [Cloacibacillus sp.]